MLPAKKEITRQVARKKITPATVHLQNSGGFLPQEMCLAGFCRRKCKKMYVKNGWRVTSRKFPNFLVAITSRLKLINFSYLFDYTMQIFACF